MLVSRRPSWRRTAREIAPALAGLALLSLVIAAVYRAGGALRAVSVPDLPLSLFGASLGIFLGFRTNSAYARWWEARILWGALVNASRTLGRQAVAFAGACDACAAEGHAEGDRVDDGRGTCPCARRFTRALLSYQLAYVHALRCRLRGEPLDHDVRRWLPDDVEYAVVAEPNANTELLNRMGDLAADAAARGMVSEHRLQQLDDTLTDVANVQGGCERIKNTPLPRQYDFFPTLFIYVYAALLPLGLVGRLGWWTPVMTALVASVLLALDRIGQNIEAPFARSVHDTPMTALCTTIEIDLRRRLGDRDTPAPAQPVLGVLH